MRMIKLLLLMMMRVMYHLFPMVNAVINSVTADDRSPC